MHLANVVDIRVLTNKNKLGTHSKRRFVTVIYHNVKKRLTEALSARSLSTITSLFSPPALFKLLERITEATFEHSLLFISLSFPTIPSIKPRALLAIVAVILVMTRTRQLQQQKKTAAALSGSLRHRRPKTKDTLEKEKRTRLLDEAIVTGNVDALRRLSVTGAGFINDGIRRRAW